MYKMEQEKNTKYYLYDAQMPGGQHCNYIQATFQDKFAKLIIQHFYLSKTEYFNKYERKGIS